MVLWRPQGQLHCSQLGGMDIYAIMSAETWVMAVNHVRASDPMQFLRRDKKVSSSKQLPCLLGIGQPRALGQAQSI